MKIKGTIGSKQVLATIEGETFTITDNNKTLTNSLVFACFQRINPRLKTCDIVWVNTDDAHVQTIDRKDVDGIRDNCHYPIFDIGADPGAWKRWMTASKKENWTLETWEALLNPVVEDSDSDWVPDGEEEESSSDEDSE